MLMKIVKFKGLVFDMSDLIEHPAFSFLCSKDLKVYDCNKCALRKHCGYIITVSGLPNTIKL